MDATAPSTSAPRGTKRKRPEPPKEHHELKAVRQAAKKARTFETQRAVKKLKGVRKKDPAASDIATLEAELEELKTADSDALAQTALRTRLLSNRHLAENVALRAAIARELPLTLPSSTGSKVPARLLSSRALAAAVGLAVDIVRAAALPKPELDAAEVDEGADKEEADEDEEEEEENEDEAEGAADAAGWESGSVNSGDGEDDEEEENDDGWESDSVHSDDGPPPAKKSASTPSISKPKSAPATKSTSSTKGATAIAKTAPANSQFLPSLAVGFVRGGSSDSDLEDVDADAGGERKNRRGQRARRAIWEKKYGRGANHKKKEAEEAAKVVATAKAGAKGKGKARWTESAQVADDGWGARKSVAPTPHAAKPRPYTAAKPHPGAKPPYTAKPQAKPDMGLHPSWVAKKALKEKLGGGGITCSTMSCPDCFRGAVLDGEPTGVISEIEGACFAAGSEGKSRRAIILLTDIFGLPLKNSKILTAQFAQHMKCDVWVPEFFAGNPPAKAAKMNKLRMPERAEDGFLGHSKARLVGAAEPAEFSVF
ncbi:BUD22-domain-containing protein [Mycena maculata]|uniref:BUD22-domain-containing protein n=1 Tax=Mycena maculata TaxID=230809 RepID=A0AAD7K8H3_9AGAR|nr:BUD22-domain-containing protein [Mycena maculata]